MYFSWRLAEIKVQKERGRSFATILNMVASPTSGANTSSLGGSKPANKSHLTHARMLGIFRTKINKLIRGLRYRQGTIAGLMTDATSFYALPHEPAF